jgi:exodeoxyribonuclease VII large subunit
MTELLRRAPRELLSRKHFQLAQFLPALQQLALQNIRRKSENLRHAELLVDSLDPRTLLTRGFSITVQNGKRIRSSGEIIAGEEMTTYFADGNVQSRVISHE